MATDESKSGSRLGQVFKEIPNWITALTGLLGVLIAAGLFAAGRASAPTSNPSSPARSGRSDGQSGQDAVPSPVGQPSSGPGALLTSYTVDVTDNYGMDLGTGPVQPAACDAGNFTANLCYNTDNGITSNGQLAVLSAAHASYQGCENDTLYENTVLPFSVGSTVCYKGGSTPPLIAAATITAIGTNPAYVQLRVQVWEGP
jgi:hypothetical protein